MSAHKKSPLSTEQWAQVEKALATPYGGDVELIADEHRLVIQVRQIKTLRYAVVVFVDGKIKQEYMQESSPIGAKFYRPSKICIYSRAQQARMVKSLDRLEFLKHDQLHSLIAALQIDCNRREG